MLCTQCDKATTPIASTGACIFLCDTATLAEQALACTTCGLVYCGACATAFAIALDDMPAVHVHVCPACSGLLSLYEA
jgi:hypothetical protein